MTTNESDRELPGLVLFHDGDRYRVGKWLIKHGNAFHIVDTLDGNTRPVRQGDMLILETRGELHDRTCNAFHGIDCDLLPDWVFNLVGNLTPEAVKKCVIFRTLD